MWSVNTLMHPIEGLLHCYRHSFLRQWHAQDKSLVGKENQRILKVRRISLSAIHTFRGSGNIWAPTIVDNDKFVILLALGLIFFITKLIEYLGAVEFCWDRHEARPASRRYSTGLVWWVFQWHQCWEFPPIFNSSLYIYIFWV